MKDRESEFVRHMACPSCGSSDGNSLYTDGHTYCFVCDTHTRGEGMDDQTTEPGSPEAAYAAIQAKESRKQKGLLEVKGETIDLPDRKLRADTLRHFGYRVIGDKHGAYYMDAQRNPVAIKVRGVDKSFTWKGDPSAALPLYGQWLWGSGKMVVVTEGEIDCLTVSQLQSNKWPTVSVPNGAAGAARSVKKALDWLEGFEKVVFMFDEDEPGRAAAKECAELLSPGRAYIASLPCKDPNECLVNGQGDAVINAVWRAKAYRPDGILNGDDLWDLVSTQQDNSSIPYPWDGLNAKTHGIRHSELVTFTAGSGIGKSAVVREIAYNLVNTGEKVGMIMLEESIRTTALSLMGLHLNRRLHIDATDVDGDQLREAYNATLGTGRVYLYDHFGSTDVDNLLSRIRYMAKALDCKTIFLDHLSIVVSGMDGDGDERRLIDRTMTMLRTLVQETGIALIIVSHLRRPEGKGHEEGAHTSLSQLRGSHAIAQLSDIVIGLERNQQGDTPNETVMRVLKNRFSGETGEAGSLFYDAETGRLTDTFAKVHPQPTEEIPF